MKPQRIVVHFRGRVQGVGFRQTTVEIAQDFAVTGTVRNLPDGGVELIAEGAKDHVSEFISAIARRMDRYVESSNQREESATGEFPEFKVIR